MGWGGYGIALAGGLLLAVTLLDIFTTAFHPTAESAMSGYFYRVVWYLAARLSRLLPPRAGRWLLSWAFPSMVAGLLVLWILALLVGFALFYAPSMGRPGAFVSSIGRLTWSNALYLSGMCLTSIGFGDIVPREGILRAAAVAEGLCGLLVVGVSITYVLAVSPVLPLLRVVAATLNEETNGHVHAVPLVRRYLAVDAAEVLAQRCRELATQLMVLAEGHTSHPVLFYAHPRRVEHSFLRVLVVSQQLIALLRYGVRRADFPALVRDPRVVGLEEGFIAIVRQLGSSLHLNLRPTTDGADDEALGKQFDNLAALLRQARLRGDDPPTPAERHAYVRFCLVTDPYISAYAANTAYSTEELWADHVPFSGSTAPLVEDDEEDAPHA